MGNLEGKVAFITGAARGQGRAHAVRLAQDGADIIGVVFLRRYATMDYPNATPQDLAETVKLVEALGRRMVGHQADVRDHVALADAFEDGVATFGRTDIVIANAGIIRLGPESSRTLSQSGATLLMSISRECGTPCGWQLRR